MSFSSNDDYPVPQLVEMTARVAETKNADVSVLHTTLAIHPDEIEVGEYTIGVKVRTAYLSVEAHGANVDPNSKHGMKKIPEVTERKKSTERSVRTAVGVTLAAEAAMTGKFDAVNVGLEQTLKASAHATETTDVTLSEREDLTLQHYPVEAIGGDRWRVADADGDSLSGYYLANDQLCRLVKKTGRPNRLGATVKVQIKRKDIDVEVVKNRAFLRISRNKESLLGILVSQHLSSQVKDTSEEVITFATTEITHEG